MRVKINPLHVVAGIFIAAAVLNAIRGEWLDLGISLALGGGLLLSYDADLNNTPALRRSPRQLAGVVLTLFALAAFTVRLAIDIAT